jgi:hypothetical protein
MSGISGNHSRRLFGKNDWEKQLEQKKYGAQGLSASEVIDIIDEQTTVSLMTGSTIE